MKNMSCDVIKANDCDKFIGEAYDCNQYKIYFYISVKDVISQ